MLYSRLATSKVKDIKTSSMCLLRLIDEKFSICENRIEVCGEIFVTDNMISISFAGCMDQEIYVAKNFLSNIDGFSIVNRYMRNLDPETIKDVTKTSLTEKFDSIKIEVLKNREGFYSIRGFWKCPVRYHLFPDFEYENNFNTLESSVAVYLRE